MVAPGAHKGAPGAIHPCLLHSVDVCYIQYKIKFVENEGFLSFPIPPRTFALSLMLPFKFYHFIFHRFFPLLKVHTDKLSSGFQVVFCT